LPPPLAALAAEPGRAAILLDVDGVLAPIVDRPEAASVPEATRAELRRLAARYALVACISGRTSEDARRVVGVGELRYVGEHGLELAPEAEEWAAVLDGLGDLPGWPVERKRLTVSLHYRLAPDRRVARAALEAVADRAREAGLVPRWGRLVLELRPPIEANKGSAVAHLLEERGVSRALYAGDDTTDLDAFAALDELELGVRVAVASEEGPAELREAADVIVDDPEELALLLGRL
jgi:trehalose 6-phosphate phosphatase